MQSREQIRTIWRQLHARQQVRSTVRRRVILRPIRRKSGGVGSLLNGTWVIARPVFCRALERKQKIMFVKKIVSRGAVALSVALLSFFSLSPNAARAQTVTGNITGAVTDPSGAALVGATVTAHNVRTGVESRATTNQAGVYKSGFCPSDSMSSRWAQPGSLRRRFRHLR